VAKETDSVALDHRSAAPPDSALGLILWIRKQAVMLDADLARLYGVETRVLVQAVKRNRERFPDDFMFQLTKDEFDDLRSQNVIPSGWGGRRSAPSAFTEHGVAMLASVLRSPQAAQVNIGIIRAFVRLRRMAGDYEELARRIAAIESRYDEQFRVVVKAIQALMGDEPGAPARKRVGFLRAGPALGEE